MPELNGAEGSTKWKVPKFSAVKKNVPEKKEDDMYTMNKLDFGESEVKERYDSIMGPLSLFAPFSNENQKKEAEEAELESIVPSLQETVTTALKMERPVTPINAEIKQTPATYNKLAKLVRRRIDAKPEMEHMSVEDQKELAFIIMGEVNGIWADLRQQVDDPFLSPLDNKELQRRTIVHIVTVCEQLFIHYINKAQILNKRGVFSGPANMSRLKAQLALDASKFLDVLTIRRYIVADMRAKPEPDSDSESYMDSPRKASLPKQPAPLLSYKGLMEVSRPKTASKKPKPLTTEENLKDLCENIQGLDTSKLLDILADIPQERVDTVLSGEQDIDALLPVFAKTLGTRKRVAEKTVQRKMKTSADVTREKLMLQKSYSVPNLLDNDLKEEFGIEDETHRNASVLEHIEEIPSSERSSQKQMDVEQVPEKPQPGSREYAQEDLRRLVGCKEKGSQLDDVDDDLPALLQAIIIPAKYDGIKEVVMKQLEELEKREEERRKQEEVHIQPPTHPQPATVPARMSSDLVMKASDIRVSERICMSSITLNKYSTVYNDLLDEIDQNTVKKLDSNLFLGDEITEVYKEIMKTVPTDHLELQNDPLIEPTAESVTLSQALASSTLSKDPKERIINPKLHKEVEPPWGIQDMRDWAKTPQEAVVDMKGRALLEPMIPKGKRDSLADLMGEQQQAPVKSEPNNALQEMMAREYASWWNWWKNTINSDDYMKYLSTQETDYLGVVYHFYNSDDEGEKEEEQLKKLLLNKTSRRARRRDRMTADDLKNMSKSQIAIQANAIAQQQERDKQLGELRIQKTEYKEGFWNANSVLLGGLGKDPELDEDIAGLSATKTPSVPDVSSSQKTPRSHKNKIGMRQALKQHLVPPESDVATAMRLKEAMDRLQEVMGAICSLHLNCSADKPKNDDRKDATTARTEQSPQEKLESVWSQLQMPDGLKLDMAIKYSSDFYHAKLNEAIEDWEAAADLILRREKYIGKLEQFERAASDPNRFFEKGKRGSSNARFKEARQRAQLYEKIDNIDNEIRNLLNDIKEDFEDDVTFQGRPYLDKMKWDRTEMLFWLQEERKQQAYEYETRIKSVHATPMSKVFLDPILPPAFN